MADWDGDDLVARLRRVTGRPASDANLTPERGRDFLNDALRELTNELAAQIPEALYGAPVEMVTDDNKVFRIEGATEGTYAEWRGRIEVYDRLGGDLLIPGAYFDESADYTIEGFSIRITGNRTRASAPWIRYVPAPTTITAGAVTTLQPVDARMALVYLAAAKWAAMAGQADPRPYLDEYRAILWGRDGYAGAVGLIPSFKQQAVAGGGSGYWWRGMA